MPTSRQIIDMLIKAIRRDDKREVKKLRKLYSTTGLILSDRDMNRLYKKHSKSKSLKRSSKRKSKSLKRSQKKTSRRRSSRSRMDGKKIRRCRKRDKTIVINDKIYCVDYKSKRRYRPYVVSR